MEDENGNEWMDQAVPSGQEIAVVMLEIEHAKGWDQMWSDYAGLRICPRVRVWLDGYADYDYERAFLLKVWTNSEPYDDEGRTLTLTDHLAVYQRHAGTGGVSVEWRNDTRLFFDVTGEWTAKGLHWWVDWITAVQSLEREPRKLSPAFEADLRQYNYSISKKDRDIARAMGMQGAMPYLLDRPDDL